MAFSKHTLNGEAINEKATFGPLTRISSILQRVFGRLFTALRQLFGSMRRGHVLFPSSAPSLIGNSEKASESRWVIYLLKPLFRVVSAYPGRTTWQGTVVDDSRHRLYLRLDVRIERLTNMVFAGRWVIKK